VKEQEKDRGATMPGPLPPPERKAAYVQEMFRQIAWRYDLMNRLMTLGRDRAWRRYTVSQLDFRFSIFDFRLGPRSRPQAAQSRVVLDLATGTGDLAVEVLRQQPEAQVVGIDFASEMLSLAQHKAADRGLALELAAGDALRLPFPDGTFDAVVTGFALRNVTSIPAAFAEMARVTRHGGRLACLEIAKPRLPLVRHLFHFYFYKIVPFLGGLVSGQRSAYSYLPHSLTVFLTPDEIVDVMRHTGWQDVRCWRLMWGTVAVHVGTRA
jgi:demethylmenaquinone methyltransferase/2-methoxy-6-polyprenyl-1,4-benzoquinol methylase